MAQAPRMSSSRWQERAKERPEVEAPDYGWPTLEVRGFKSLRDPLSIAFAPLTVLAGQNSSGKSSIMQPLLLIKQTLEVAYDPGPLLIDGSNASFSTAKEMTWRGEPSWNSDSPSFQVTHTDFDGERTSLTFEATAHGMDLTRLDYSDGLASEEIRRISLHPGMSQAALRASAPSQFRELLEGREARDGFSWRFELTRSRCFFEVAATAPKDAELGPFPIPLTNFYTLRNVASRLIHLPGLRDTPARFYPATQVGDVFPGVFTPYVASIISSWGETKDPRLKVLGTQLRALGLTWKVDAKRVDDTRVALRVGRLPRARQGGGRDMVNIADVGLGVSQTLPILVALLSAKPGQIVYLEQPEIHLHPRAQVALADLLLDAAQTGVQVVTETHSYLLLKAIQAAVVRRELGDEFVNLHWFSRDDEGASHSVQAVMDEQGRIGDWPTDFAQVELEVEDQYLSAVLGL